MGYIIGADVGSQSVKVLMMDPEGVEVATASAPCEMSHPAAGWAEQEPVSWTRALGRAVSEARARAGVRRGDIEMLAVASQVDGLVAVDSDLNALRPAIIWLDRRATEQSERLSQAIGESELAARTGLVPNASHTGPKAMWFREEEGGVYERTRWLASVGAHLNGWLTGEVVHDHAHASSTLLYDLAARSWSSQLVESAGLDAGRLPPIRAATEVIGTLRPEAAEALDLDPGCRVAVGTGDDHAAALGAGALDPGVVVDITGTAEPVVAPSATIVLDDERLVETHAHAVDGRLLVENPGFVAGGSTQWLARLHGITQAELLDRAAAAPPGAGGVLFLPCLSGSMTPRWNDRMRGVFAGLALSHDFANLARAVLEGCAFALRDVVDRFDALGLGGEEIRVVGGGARSQLWLQIKADVTGQPVRPLEGQFATSTGAAMLAGVAAGCFRDLGEAAARCVHLAPDAALPSTDRRATYDEAYAAYRRLYDDIEGAFA
jgi:xylulokinase